MPLGLVGGAIPSEAFREAARSLAEAPNEGRRRGERAHCFGHRRDVAVGHEEPRLAISDRLADTRGVGGDDGGAACGRLEVRDAPTLLRRGEDQSPGAPEQRELLRLGYTPKKPNAVVE